MSKVVPSENAVPKAPSEEEIAWVRHLLRDERNMVLNTGHMSPLYSAFDETSRQPRFVWRSFTTTRHSQFIDGLALERADGRAPVEILVYDSKSSNVSVTFEALARRVPAGQVPAALTVYTAIRQRRKEETESDRPEIFYEAVIIKATIPVGMFEPDARRSHTGESHAEVRIDQLKNLSGQGH